MAGIPSGISTALVHLDAPISFIGDVGRIQATVTSNVPLVWAATGTPIGNFIDNVSLDPGIPLELRLPHTDQAGFLDGSGNKMTGWYYRVEITYERDGQAIAFPSRDFQILKGQTNVDLALIPGGKVTDPVIAPVGSVVSVGGHTGAVTLEKLELNRVDNTPDLEKPVSNPVNQVLAAKADAQTVTEALNSKADATSTTTALSKKADVAALDKTVADLGSITAAHRGVAVPEVRGGYLYVTDSMTGKRRQVTSANQVLGGTPTTLGEGVVATIDGSSKWISPSGYPRPVDTVFTKASIWGSSTASRMGGELGIMFGKHGMGFLHSAGAVGGFQISHIAAAIGVRPLLAEAFTIPAGVTPVKLNLLNMNEINNTSVNVAWTGTFEGTGVAGLIQSFPNSPDWTFTRTTAGSAVAVPASTPYIPARALEYQSGVTILNPGKNTISALTSEWTIERVIELTNEMFDFFSGAGRNVLVMGHFVDTGKPANSITRAPIQKFNTYMKARYGGRFFDLSEYLTGSQVWADMGITPTAVDLAEQALGNKPPSVSGSSGGVAGADAQHLSDAADEAVTRVLEAKLADLGWLNVVPPPRPLTRIADDFNRPDGDLGITSVNGESWKPQVGSTLMPRIEGNKMMNREPNSVRRAVLTPPSGHQNYEISARIAALGAVPADKSIGIIARVVDYNNLIYMSPRQHNSAEGASFWKLVNGTLYQVGTANTTVKSAAGQVWKMRVEGNTFTGYIDGVQVLQATDETMHKTGDAGLMLSGGTSAECAWDDFEIVKIP